MPWFPIFIDLKDKPVLIVGGGAVALRKLEKLLPYGAKITVAAPKILSGFEDFPGIKLKRKNFTASDLRPRPSMVIAATDSKKINSRVSFLCRKHHIPVNVADDPALCSFLFPALIQRGAFSVGISTGGASPVAAAYFKALISEMLPKGLEELLTWLEALRPQVKAAMPKQSDRGAVFQRLFDAGMARGAPLSQAETEKYIAGEHGRKTREKDTACKPAGSVALVGAGCGRADLITVRGLRLLERCQAVVYDDLIDTALLDAAPEFAERIYVGKRNGAHGASQDEINQKLMELARRGLKVVRLKGGDPYLFGRGGEEMMALLAAGISCQEVPGIPSPIGIAAQAGIPVTHRGISRGVHIITAHTADTGDGLPEDFDTLAKLSGTLIFLMGLERLSVITARLIEAGKDPDTPAAVVSGGNAPKPAQVRAPLQLLGQAAEDAGVSAPAIIIVGVVASMDLSAASHEPEEGMNLSAASHEPEEGMNLSAVSHEPKEVMNLSAVSHETKEVMSLSAAGYRAEEVLNGIRIGITGTQEIAEKQRLALSALGAKAVWVMRSEIKELSAAYDRRIFETDPCWIVFTSANGVKTFFGQMAAKGIDMRSMKDIFPKGEKFAVIGPATGKALLQYGIAADLCPDVYTSENLAAAIAASARVGERVVLLRSALGTRTLPEMLIKAGFAVEDIPVYDLEYKFCDETLSKLDYLTFSSAEGVKAFFKRYGGVPEGVCCVCIGSVTAKTLAQYVSAPFLTSLETSAEGIVETILHDSKK